MAITRAAIPDLLKPGLADVEGKYPQIPTQYVGVYNRGNSKMYQERSAEMRYTALAALKAEGSATLFDNASGERYVYNTLMLAFGLGFAQTRESLDDNLYKDQFGPQTMGLAESFAQTKEIIHANVLNDGDILNASVVGDGQPLFSTAHPIDSGTYANRPTPDMDLSESAIEYALQQIRVFPDQAGNRMLARGRKMFVPIALEFVAERLCNAELRPGTADNDITAFLSAGGLPEKYQVMDFLSSPYAWGIITTIKGLVSYDRVAFELDMQVDPVTGNLLVIGYERYGAAWKNPRGAWMTFPTA